MKKAIFSVSLPSTFKQATLLHESLEKYAKDFDYFHLCITDPTKTSSLKTPPSPKTQWIHLDALDFNPYDWRKLAFQYEGDEFAACLKPFVFEFLFKQGYESVLYFSSEIEIYHSLDEMTQFLNSYEALLTPHITQPLPLHENTPSNEDFLQLGVYNANFLGIKLSQDTRHFLSYWKDRSGIMCLKKDYKGMMHIDSHLLSFIPSWVQKTKTLTSHSFHLSFWNHSQRALNLIGEHTYSTKDGPLVFCDFSNFNFETLNLLSSQPFHNLLNSYLSKLQHVPLNAQDSNLYDFDYYMDGNLITFEDRKFYLFLHALQKASLGNPFVQREYFKQAQTLDPLRINREINSRELQYFRAVFQREFRDSIAALHRQHQEDIQKIHGQYEQVLQKHIADILNKDIYKSLTWRLGRACLLPFNLCKKISRRFANQK